MKTIQRLTLCALFALCSLYANAYSFSAKNDDGVTIYYNIVSSSDYTCEVVYKDHYTRVYSGDIVIPETVTHSGTTYTVVGIGEDAFFLSYSLTSVVIPNSVTYIGDYAFGDCYKLTSIKLGTSVESIEQEAFRDCTSLTSVDIPDSVTKIDNDAFDGCTGLTSVNINNCVAETDSRIFDGCTSLEKFEVAESNQAYSTSDGVLFSKDMTTLVAFPHGSPLLPSYDIPDNVTTIRNYAFYGCSGLTSVTIPNSVTTIGDYAFWDCTGLTSVVIPDSVSEIGTWTFCGCSSLTSVDFGNSVTEIGSSAFSRCTGLISLTLCNSVTEIGSCAFMNCSGLTSMIIGKRVNYIASYAFAECTSLEEIYSLNPEPPKCYYDAFNGVDKNTCILYVPIGSYSAYATADTWEEFLNIVEMDMTGIESVIASSEDIEVVGYYTIDGKAVDAPQRGINIVKYSDGSTKKVMMK